MIRETKKLLSSKDMLNQVVYRMALPKACEKNMIRNLFVVGQKYMIFIVLHPESSLPIEWQEHSEKKHKTSIVILDKNLHLNL